MSVPPASSMLVQSRGGVGGGGEGRAAAPGGVPAAMGQDKPSSEGCCNLFGRELPLFLGSQGEGLLPPLLHQEQASITCNLVHLCEGRGERLQHWPLLCCVQLGAACCPQTSQWCILQNWGMSRDLAVPTLELFPSCQSLPTTPVLRGEGCVRAAVLWRLCMHTAV